MVVNEQALRNELSQAEWDFPQDIYPFLAPYEKRHLEIEMTGERSLSYYMKRLEAINFTGLDRVLDAACGVGQWTIALANLNGKVDGVDISTTRLLTGRELARSMGKTNCCFNFSYLEELPFDDATFSGVFCYSAITLCDVPKVLSEFKRVLKPQGRLYFNANSWGWHAHTLIDKGIRRGNLVEIFESGRMILRGLLGKDRRIMVRENYILNKLNNLGLKVIAEGMEGEVCLIEPKLNLKPMYPSQYYGLPSILELVVEKI